LFTFEKPGKDNTINTLELAVKRGIDLGIKDIVVASNEGYTIDQLLNILERKNDKYNIVCVTHHVGFKEPGYDEMAPEKRDKFAKMGIKVLTTTHLFGNIERAITNKFGGLYPGGIVSSTLRCFSQGVKVCFEIGTMALDAGMIPHGKEVIAIGGTGRGCDTAMVIKPAHGKDFFATTVQEIICMPRGK
jgi:hypothetical protein